MWLTATVIQLEGTVMEKVPKLNRSDVVYKINYAGGDSSSKITTRHMLIGKKSVYLVESVLKFVAWNRPGQIVFEIISSSKPYHFRIL